MLMVNPAERMTAEAALLHPWLVRGGDAEQAARRQGGRLAPLRACEIVRDGANDDRRNESQQHGENELTGFRTVRCCKRNP